MGKKLFVGNLAYAVTEDELRQLFEQIGPCESASVVMDRDTGQSRGFAFVMMANPADAERAKKELDGTELRGRRLRVDEANDQSAGRGGSRGAGQRR
ncbi:MAG TPA: RNA-binding protein [Candidatus Binatia bacterium]|nr:RNA-binding protein [Candidatus Binatia bacterium]